MIFRLIIFLSLCITALADTYTNVIAGQAFDSGTLVTTISGVSSSFTPTNVSNCNLFLNYLDMPTNSMPVGWTNQVDSSMVYTNLGSTAPTNSPLGMYFPGNTSQYLWNTNGANWVATNDSLWITFSLLPATAQWACILGTEKTIGRGLYGPVDWTSYGDLIYLHDQNNYWSWKWLTTNISYSVSIVPGGYGAYPTIYTNGILADSSWTTVPDSSFGTKIIGIGRDADTDNQFNGFIRFVAVYTNYSLTGTDIGNLQNYANTH